MISSEVWERGGTDEMTRGSFYLVLGMILSWGFALTTIVAQATGTWEPGIGGILLVGLGVPIVGIFLSVSSGNALVSFLGFNLVVGGLSAILGPVLVMYEMKEPGLIERAATMTGLVTATMGVSGLLFPNFYRSIGGALFGALTALVVVSFARLFIPAIQGVGVIDYASALIFALYIGYDMWRASEIPATLDNAVDVAVSLYLDIINLFLDLLRIMSSSDD
jgi:FtsH-binding integral membrane protein